MQKVQFDVITTPSKTKLMRIEKVFQFTNKNMLTNQTPTNHTVHPFQYLSDVNNVNLWAATKLTSDVE